MLFELQTYFNLGTVWLVGAAPYLAAGAFALSLLCALFVLALRRRFVRLALGRAGTLEETIGILSRDMKELHTFRTELERYLKLAETRLRGSIRGVGLVRFNPFEGQGAGGNQSFAAAFLDEQGDGMILSTLYSRDRVGVYAKPVAAHQSTYELTAEEKEALELARHKAATPKKETRA